jgi:glycosidase
MKNFSAFLICFLVCTVLQAQKAPAITRVDPTNWWVGMKNPNVQLLVYGPQVGTMNYTISYPGVRLVKTSKVENPNYAFLDLYIAATTRPGTLNIIGRNAGNTIAQTYELKARTKEVKGTGLTAADFIYLIMPDRFANGDASNDKFVHMADTAADANNPILRHGGDLQGITNHLDYLQELGATALWLTPVIENDEQLKLEGHGMMQAGYHGYHFTDHYKIDPRFGGNAGYIAFAKELHRRGMKLVQDAVYNHVSDDHWMYKDQPTKDWFNNWPVYTNTSHKEFSLADPHGAAVDRRLLLDGWFTSFLPDFNHRNPFLANYLIQHAIWSTEMFSLDAWRIDTYKYNDPAFMNRCNQALMTEYPNIHLFGETVANTPYSLSYFVKNNVAYPFKSNLPGSNDFPLNYAIFDALNQDFSWDGGVNRVYQVLAQDALYADPNKLVTQVDNHDMDRFLSVIGGDYDKYKLGVTWLLTTRGIPSWYYGTEILMKNTKNPTDAEVRRNFPGGFAGDKQNKFTAAGRDAKENEAFDFVKKLANFRKNTPALHSGKLTQFVPEDGVYVYFRHDNNKTIMVASNTNATAKTIETIRFAERMSGFKGARNVLTGETVTSLSFLVLPAKTAVVLELLK